MLKDNFFLDTQYIVKFITGANKMIDRGDPKNKDLIQCWLEKGEQPGYFFPITLKQCCESVKKGIYMNTMRLCKSLSHG